MFNFDNRKDERRNIAVYAFVSDFEETIEVRCVIRDATKNGCMLISRDIHELPTMVHITPEGFEKPLCGQIRWRSGKTAGVKFVRESKHPDQALVDMLLSSPEGDDDDVLLLTNELKPSTFEQRMKKHGFK